MGRLLSLAASADDVAPVGPHSWVTYRSLSGGRRRWAWIALWRRPRAASVAVAFAPRWCVARCCRRRRRRGRGRGRGGTVVGCRDLVDAPARQTRAADRRR